MKADTELQDACMESLHSFQHLLKTPFMELHEKIIPNQKTNEEFDISSPEFLRQT